MIALMSPPPEAHSAVWGSWPTSQFLRQNNVPLGLASDVWHPAGCKFGHFFFFQRHHGHGIYIFNHVISTDIHTTFFHIMVQDGDNFEMWVEMEFQQYIILTL